jgi:hypothetical protein
MTLDIPNFPNYAVDMAGRVYSKNYRNSSDSFPLHPILSFHGYPVVCLSLNKQMSVAVHKLVALAFLGPRPKGMEINHINGDKTDNRLVNIEYTTRSGNQLHAWNIGLQKHTSEMSSARALGAKASAIARRILTTNDVAAIRNEYALGFTTIKTLAKQYGMSKGSILDIVRHRTYTKWLY